MTVKAVFFDIDGTLLTDSRTVSESTLEGIQALKERGILVGLATGRDPRFLLKYMASLNLDVAVAYNGQYIFSREEVLFSQELDKESLTALMDYAEVSQKDLAFGTARGVEGSAIMSFGMGGFSSYVSRWVPKSWTGFVHFVFNRLIRRFRPQQKMDLYDVVDQPVYQMILLATERESERLQQQFPALSFTRSSPYATDILSKGMSKFVGLQKVGEWYGFEMEDVMAFGDADNDLEMLAGVGYSVAMGNASKRAKQVARYVTDTNNRDGIFKAIQKLVLEKENKADAEPR